MIFWSDKFNKFRFLIGRRPLPAVWRSLRQLSAFTAQLKKTPSCKEPSPIWIWYMKEFSLLMIALNSAANFLIYFWRREEFRKIWKKIYCCRKTPDRRNSNKLQVRFSTPTAITTCQRNWKTWRDHWNSFEYFFCEKL